MKKKHFCIIGSPISHTLSPILHKFWFKKYNIDAEYGVEEPNDKNLKNIISKVREKKISGINVTLPFKQKIIPHLDKIINDAKETGSVNTVFLDRDDNVVGDNTDVFGIQAAYLKEILNESNNLRTVIMGAGGVAPSVIFALNKSNLNDITLVNRTHEKSLFLKKQFPVLKIERWENVQDICHKFDIIVNCTSLGLKEEKDLTIKLNKIKENSKYIDLIYNPLNTSTILHLKKMGIKTFNGLDMLIYQGQKSFFIWNKISPEINDDLISLLENNLKK